HTEVGYVGALGLQPGGECGLQHWPRQARVAADEEGPPGQRASGRSPERHDQLGCELAVGDAPDPVGTELQRHATTPQTRTRCSGVRKPDPTAARTASFNAWSTAAPYGPS